MPAERPIALLTGSSNPDLAKKIGSILEIDVHNPTARFADSEIKVTIPVNLRRCHVFILQPTSPPVNDHIMELLLMADAARRASAEEITAVIPYFGYSRQDRKEKPRVPISAAVIVKILEVVGIQRILTVDIHSEQQQGFFHGPWDNVFGSYSLIPEIKARRTENLVVAAPDKGGTSRAVAYANRLNAEGIVFVYKERDINRKNHSAALDMAGDAKGKNILIVDDIVDSAGTIINASKLLNRRGAMSIVVAATHGLFSKDALERLLDSPIEKLFVTDTIAHREEVVRHPKIKIISIANLLAECIIRIQSGRSISEGLIL